MEQHFVIFTSPGSFVNEETRKSIDSWDVNTAVKMAKDITERYNAKPFGFYFQTRKREDHELDSKVSNTSGMYYLGGKVETYEEVCARNDPKEEILRSNMKWNNWNKIIVNTNSWKYTAPIRENDTVLDMRNY